MPVVWNRPNHGNGRQIVDGQMIHKSVFTTCTMDYVSRAHLPLSAVPFVPVKWLRPVLEERAQSEAIKSELLKYNLALEEDFDDLVLDLLNEPQKLQSVLSSAEDRRKLLEAPNKDNELFPLFVRLILNSTTNQDLIETDSFRLLVLGEDVSLLMTLAMCILGHASIGPIKHMSVVFRSLVGPRTPGAVHFSITTDPYLPEALLLENLHPDYEEHQISRLPPIPNSGLALALLAAARWRWYMDQKPRSNLLSDEVEVTLKFVEVFDWDTDFKLYENQGKTSDEAPRSLSRTNLLCQDTVEVVGRGNFGDPMRFYGMTITNESGLDLYLYILWFDSDLGFRPYYLPRTSDQPSLLAGQSLNCLQGGETGSPRSYTIPFGQDHDVGFIKLILTTTRLHSGWEGCLVGGGGTMTLVDRPGGRT
ncbi:hypothetical protein GLOTRDRAFT_93613 [Gloeophyllum trabeum ATCC 11539]|uniref:Uncharacterized protein n=1 Tax=Gloeophyllum trabeum (strain ATCC 11539 / FP-39264 / Madison 617) TaxID=670483 RepID=S7RQ83_GLOTA|nr:uncharacterized protein GLOTRDRAFT_93613 [Gloeophyllum trabeum ATCC 11539]EPQ55049.1 hypothetical protein GLOTRDRAFT_93613 [Gloeophyllum trabeum ATCC 11539]